MSFGPGGQLSRRARRIHGHALTWMRPPWSASGSWAQRIDFLATGETTAGHYSLFHVFVPAGPPGPVPHVHRHADEFFFVLEGRIEVLFEDAWRPLGDGEFLHVPRGTLHTFNNATTDPSRMLSGFAPAGFERFFRDFGRPARPEDVKPLPVQEEEVQRLKVTAGQYDMELGRAHERGT